MSKLPNAIVEHAGSLSEEDRKIFTVVFTCTAAFVLLTTFFASITRFWLWHSSRILEAALGLVHSPLTFLLTSATGLITSATYRNDLYLIWQAVLIIGYDDVLIISAGSGPRAYWLLRSYIQVFLAAYYGFFIFKGRVRQYYYPILVLWLLVLVKLSFQLVAQKFVQKAYGLNNTKLLADYMKVEDELTKPNETIDPTSMNGYKYIVLGEWKINANVKGPDYNPQIDLPADVVTVDRAWSCNTRHLHSCIVSDTRVKNVCLSFAFFKLLKRRFFEYPAAEAQQEKTRKLVFDGLLSLGTNDVFSVVGMELGFLRDYFYTRYPVIFALGFPVFNVIVLNGILGVSLWILVKVFRHRHEDPGNSYLWIKQHNIDYIITNILLIILLVIETLGTMIYVFSDWAKVMLICRHVKSQISHPYLDKVTALICGGAFFRSLNDTIGQYSLLQHYKIYKPPRSNWFCFSTWGWSPLVVAPKGMKRNKSVILSPDVKEAILSSLRMINGDLTNGVSSLRWNGVYGDLEWTCALKSEYHTLMVWHIATCLCGIHPILDDQKSTMSIEPHHLVATHLSNYCAYLMVFVPDMLPESFFSVKLLFQEILSETKEFFEKANNHEEEYTLMMKFKCSHHQGLSIIHMGLKLGRSLMRIPDEAHRWKIMADFWSEFIIFLAPSGKFSEHRKKLRSGGEFITHLWALLYHAGIIGPTASATSWGNVP